MLWHALLLLLSIVDPVSARGKNKGNEDTPTPSESTSSTDAHSSTPSPSRTSSTAPSPSSSFSFQFTPPNDTVICDSTTFFWSSSGLQNRTIALSVTNNVSSSNLSPPLLINQVIIDNITIATQEYTWLRANVPAGRYAVQALQGEGTLNTSSSFLVQDGPDKSCLLGNSDTATSKTPTPSSPSMSPPISHHLTAAPLTGTVLGAVSAFLVVYLAFRFPRWWRRALPSSKSRRPYILY